MLDDNILTGDYHDELVFEHTCLLLTLRESIRAGFCFEKANWYSGKSRAFEVRRVWFLNLSSAVY